MYVYRYMIAVLQLLLYDDILFIIRISNKFLHLVYFLASMLLKHDSTHAVFTNTVLQR